MLNIVTIGRYYLLLMFRYMQEHPDKKDRFEKIMCSLYEFLNDITEV